jgi:hypothetical protein
MTTENDIVQRIQNRKYVLQRKLKKPASISAQECLKVVLHQKKIVLVFNTDCNLSFAAFCEEK